jgi:uncharacterized membrane protein YjjP (DUF1212 family)
MDKKLLSYIVISFALLIFLFLQGGGWRVLAMIMLALEAVAIALRPMLKKKGLVK